MNKVSSFFILKGCIHHMDRKTKDRVKEQIINIVEKVITKRVIEEPFNETEIKESNPFGFRLVPIEVWKGSKFERSFVTNLGQNIFEQIGKIVAEGAGAYAENQYKKEITINNFRKQMIENLVANPPKGRKKPLPNLQKELEEINRIEVDILQKVVVISDLYIRRPDGQEEFYSFKTAKPNQDQTKAAKANLLYLRTTDPNCEAYFALPYNPAGNGEIYRKSGHTFPYSWFDMEDSKFVLVGSKLWNKIGNDPNTYNDLLDIFTEVGKLTTQRIRTEYLYL
jgi:hypothetical protein